MFLVWWLGFRLPAFENTPETRSAFYRAMTLMVVASPCALVLSIRRRSSRRSLGRAQRSAVSGRSGNRETGRYRRVALDKTGTLTTGELAVVGTESYPPGREQQILQLAYALEAKSHHPLPAPSCGTPAAQIPEIAVEDFQSLTGQGSAGRLTA